MSEQGSGNGHQPMDLTRVRAAHEERGRAMREPDNNRRIITRAKVRTDGNLVKQARVGKFTFQGEVDASRLATALDWAESVCHVVRSLKEPVPVDMALNLNGESVVVAAG